MDIILKENQKALIIAPHQDDETIGCGGFLAKYPNNCDILLLTDGINYAEGECSKEIQKTRNIELKNAMKIIGITNIKMLNIKNGDVKKSFSKIEEINLHPYKYVFVPNRYEAQPDHKAVYTLIKRLKTLSKAKASIIEYEVWTPLQSPTTLFDISGVINTKKDMIKAYKSQLKDRNYLNATIGLNAYRGMIAKTKYAEAYCDSNYSGIKKTIYELMPNGIKNIIKSLITH